MKRYIILALMGIFLISACKKEDKTSDNTPQESVLDYFPLNVGNYWVYERSMCDSTWVDCQTRSTDTNFVTKDTIINSFTFYKIEGKALTGQIANWYYRDSLNYIIDNNGVIIFSNNDFTNKLTEEYIITNQTDTIFYWYTRMQQDLNSVNVPAGDFNCLDNKLSFYRSIDNFDIEFDAHYLFAKDVGLVFENAMFASNLSGYKSELVDFKIIPKSKSLQP